MQTISWSVVVFKPSSICQLCVKIYLSGLWKLTPSPKASAKLSNRGKRAGSNTMGLPWVTPKIIQTYWLFSYWNILKPMVIKWVAPFKETSGVGTHDVTRDWTLRILTRHWKLVRSIPISGSLKSDLGATTPGKLLIGCRDWMQHILDACHSEPLCNKTAPTLNRGWFIAHYITICWVVYPLNTTNIIVDGHWVKTS